MQTLYSTHNLAHTPSLLVRCWLLHNECIIFSLLLVVCWFCSFVGFIIIITKMGCCFSKLTLVLRFCCLLCNFENTYFAFILFTCIYSEHVLIIYIICVWFLAMLTAARVVEQCFICVLASDVSLHNHIINPIVSACHSFSLSLSRLRKPQNLNHK